MVAVFLFAGMRRSAGGKQVVHPAIDCASRMLALRRQKKRPGFHRARLSILFAMPAAIALRHP